MDFITKVEVCVNNLPLGSEDVCQQVKQHYPEIEVTEWECLGYCHLCYRQPAVLINDTEYLQAATAQELWHQIQAQIEKRNGR